MLRTVLAAALLAMCACARHHPAAVDLGPSSPIADQHSDLSERADRGRVRPLQPPAAPDTRSPLAARPAPQRTVRPPVHAVQAAPASGGAVFSSTAYCLTGGMADGKATHAGAVAGNRWPLGTRLRVSDSPYGPGVFIVEDRIGSGSQLDFALPGDCAGARRWGRRTVTVTVED